MPNEDPKVVDPKVTDPKVEDPKADPKQVDPKVEDPKPEDTKFTQDDLNKFAAKVRAEEKAKFDKLQADAKRQKELDGMGEIDRIKAEKEDSENKLAELQKQVDFNNKKTEALAKLGEAKLDNRLIDVLMSDKSNDDKIKLIADIQKEAIDKAIKEAMPSHKPSGLNGKEKDGEDKKNKYGFERFK